MKYVLVFILATFTSITFACSCIDNPPFLHVAPHASFIALVKVTKLLNFKTLNLGKGLIQIPTSMEVQIIKKYKGEASSKKILVKGSTGWECEEYLVSFKEKNYYIIAFKPGSTDYRISNCGRYWLNVNRKHSIATGKIDSRETDKTIKIKKLVAALHKEM